MKFRRRTIAIEVEIHNSMVELTALNAEVLAMSTANYALDSRSPIILYKESVFREYAAKMRACRVEDK